MSVAAYVDAARREARAHEHTALGGREAPVVAQRECMYIVNVSHVHMDMYMLLERVGGHRAGWGGVGGRGVGGRAGAYMFRVGGPGLGAGCLVPALPQRELPICRGI